MIVVKFVVLWWFFDDCEDFLLLVFVWIGFFGGSVCIWSEREGGVYLFMEIVKIFFDFCIVDLIVGVGNEMIFFY